VLKSAEVLIKVATVSEKVHGPWYKALVWMWMVWLLWI